MMLKWKRRWARLCGNDDEFKKCSRYGRNLPATCYQKHPLPVPMYNVQLRIKAATNIIMREVLMRISDRHLQWIEPTIPSEGWCHGPTPLYISSAWQWFPISHCLCLVGRGIALCCGVYDLISVRAFFYSSSPFISFYFTCQVLPGKSVNPSALKVWFLLATMLRIQSRFQGLRYYHKTIQSVLAKKRHWVPLYCTVPVISLDTPYLIVVISLLFFPHCKYILKTSTL